MIEFIKTQLVPKPKSLLYALLAFIVLNGFWMVASHWIFIFRPYVNYDYGLAFMLAPFSLVLSIFALVVVYVLELAITNALVFHFDGIFDFIQSAEFAGALNFEKIISLGDIVLFAGFLLCAAIATWLIRYKSNIISVAIIMVSAFAADQVNGSSYLIKSDKQVIKGNISGSSALQIYGSYKQVQKDNRTGRPMVDLDPADLPVTLEGLTSWAQQHPQKSILFVIVESMGTNKNEAVNDWLYAQINHGYLDKEYDIERGYAVFKGATTAAELRHLCGVRGKYNSAFADDLTQKCLPRVFADKGYAVVGAHGFTPNMFRRNEWWPEIGIQELLFVKEFNAMGAPRCGSGFYGTCDTYIVQYLAERTQKEKGFYYHLTLNSHFPIVDVVMPEDLKNLCNQYRLSEETCAMNAKVGEYLRALSKSLSTLVDKPYVFVVGDHLPPFPRSYSRRDFINETTPYFILRPKE